MNTAGGNKAAIQEYIKDQEAEEQTKDQFSSREYEDPFKDMEEIK